MRPVVITDHAMNRYHQRVNPATPDMTVMYLLTEAVRRGPVVGRGTNGTVYVTLHHATNWRAVVREDRDCLVVLTVMHGQGECERRAA